MMPVLPQTPVGDESIPLSRQREVSSIPKADEAGNWVYPSPQQFYHAILRRKKEAEAEAMDAVVFAHNVTNERTWEHIMEWEGLHRKVCPTPKLLRFVGRSEDLSHGAWWTSKFSYLGKPFDRHDWYVDRCGLKTVRYVIDYYDDPKATEDGLEITIDARPVLDSLGAWTDRMRRPLLQAQRVWGALFGR
jgi:cytochrome c heme-lyase